MSEKWWEAAPLVEERTSAAGPSPWEAAPLVASSKKAKGLGRIARLLSRSPALSVGEHVAAERGKMLGFARRRLAKAWLPNVKATAVGLGASVVSPVQRLFGYEEAADFTNRFSAAYQQAAAERDKETWMPDIIERSARGVGQMLPTMIVGARLAGPYGALGAAGGLEANRAITEGKDAGLKGRDLAAYVTAKGAIEFGVGAVAQKLGLGGVENAAAGKVAVRAGLANGLARTAKVGGRVLIEEIPEEVITEIGHNAADALSGVRPEALEPEQIAQTVADTTVQTLMTVGAVAGPIAAQAAVAPSADAEGRSLPPKKTPKIIPGEIGLEVLPEQPKRLSKKEPTDAVREQAAEPVREDVGAREREGLAPGPRPEADALEGGRRVLGRRQEPGPVPEPAPEAKEQAVAEPPEDLGLMSMAALRETAKTEGVVTTGHGHLSKKKLADLIVADREAKATEPAPEPPPKKTFGRKVEPAEPETELPPGPLTEQQQDAIIRQYQGTALRVAARFSKPGTELRDQLEAEANFALTKLVAENYGGYDPSKGPFGAYVAGSVRNALADWVRKNKPGQAMPDEGAVAERTAEPRISAEETADIQQAVAETEATSEYREGVRALRARAAGKGYAAQAREQLGPEASEAEVENLRRRIGEAARRVEAPLAARLAKRRAKRAGPKTPVPVTPLPQGSEAPSTGQVVSALSSNFQLPIRTGHFRAQKGQAGIYKEMEEVARIKGYGNIATAAHEVAHHVDKTLDPLRHTTALMWGELAALDYKPGRGDVREGFAEYVRHRLTMDDASTVAPQFDAWFSGAWLPANRATAAAFARSRAAIDQWRNAGALSRVAAQIDTGESRWTRVGRALRRPQTLVQWTTDNWINRLNPLLRASKQMTGARSSGEVMARMAGDVNFWAFAKVSNLASAAKARGWAEHGVADVAGNKISAGLRETLAPIADQLTDRATLHEFYSYCYARHALDVIAQGKEPGISRQDAQFVVTRFDAKPGWRDASDGLTAWHNGLIDYLVDAGGLSGDAADSMKAVYPHYIALARKMDSQFLKRAGTGGARYADLPTAIKRLKGSGRQILPPLESAMAYAERIIGIADKVRVGRMLIEASETHGTLGDTVEKVDPKLRPATAKVASLKSQLEKAGADLSGTDMDALLTIFSQEFTGDPKDNILTLYRNGKRECYYVRDDLYRALVAYDKPARLPAILDHTVGSVARTIRLGATGVRAGFSLLTNPLRDVQTALMQTEYQPRNPFGIIRNAAEGLVDELTGSEVAQFWERGGGPMAQPLGIDRAFLKEAVNDLVAQTPQAKALNWMQHPIDSLRSLFSLPESAPRLAEFRAALEQLGWRPGQKVTFEQYVKAQLAAANVSVDFREGGTLAMWMNQIVPFFNAGIQGPARMASAIRNHPAATTAAGILWLTLPTLGLWLKQKDEDWYRQLTPMERYRYWHVRLPGTDTVLRIPKPFEWGHFFSSMPEGALESMRQKDPSAITEAAASAIRDMSPNVVPGIAEAPIEIVANRDFYFDRPLVSEGMKNLLPKDQYNPYTSETAKRIGALFGVSPIYVEHLASGWTGGLATDAVKALETTAGFATKKAARQVTGGPSTIPVAGRLFLSPLHTRAFDDFYTQLEQLEAEHGSAKLGRPAIAASAVLKKMRRASNAMMELRKEGRTMLEDPDMTDDEKRDSFRDIHKKMVKIAQKACNEAQQPSR